MIVDIKGKQNYLYASFIISILGRSP